MREISRKRNDFNSLPDNSINSTKSIWQHEKKSKAQVTTIAVQNPIQILCKNYSVQKEFPNDFFDIIFALQCPEAMSKDKVLECSSLGADGKQWKACRKGNST